jgi:hypothetical protein
MIKKAMLGMIFFAVIIYFTFTHYFGDVQINKYDSKSVVKQEQAIEHGWVPGIIPDSAFEITETHNIDTNEIFGSFKYKQEDEEKFMKDLTIIPDSNETYGWGNFLFKINREKSKVQYRNNTKSSS